MQESPPVFGTLQSKRQLTMIFLIFLIFLKILNNSMIVVDYFSD